MTQGQPVVADIINSLPQRFRPEKAGSYSTLVHLIIKGDGGGEFTVTVNSGTCSVEAGLQGEPKCMVRTSVQTYIDLELGEANPQMALMTGKLQVSGIPEMLKFSKLFKRYRTEGRSGHNTQHTSSRKPVTGPLQGIRILDLTRLLPGPLATMMMADMGAEVIKIEDPHNPDYIRSFPPFRNSEPVNYLALNRSKRSMALNLQTAEGREIFKRLVQTADVVIEQFRPGVLSKMDIGYGEAKEWKKDIIYISITGYGQTGPYAHKAGHDINYISYAGVLGINGSRDTGPLVPGVQLADIAGGSYSAVNACLAAILSRKNTGQGQHVDVSMMDCVMPLLSLVGAQHYAGLKAERGDMHLSGALGNYNVYRCKDGRYIALGALEPKFWQQFCEMVNKPEWVARISDIDPASRALLKEEVQALFLTKERDEWVQISGNADVCLSPVLNLDEAANNEQVKARGMITETGGIKSIGIPLKFSGTPATVAWAAPELGEDTQSILLEAGYSDEAIKLLKEDGVIGTV